MSYIWGSFLKGKSNFHMADIFSPYLEVIDNESLNVPVNPIIRFNDIFCNIEKFEELLNYSNDNLENILFNILLRLDLCKGLDYRQIKADFLEKEILAGYFGDEIIEIWNNLNHKDKTLLLDCLVLKSEGMSSGQSFIESLSKMFDVISLIKEKNMNNDIYYLYISNAFTEYNDIRLQAAKTFFWNENFILNEVWHYHYGIIGNTDTMKINNIQII